MADDTLVLEQAVDVAPAEGCNLVEIETVESGAEVLAFRQDGAPAQAGLKPFQAQLLE